MDNLRDWKVSIIKMECAESEKYEEETKLPELH